ncbi:MAG: pyruvate dehydrogenase (acetyl-transferring) E1 component subunit alpha, partial [Alphaproteobacteria bacterium]|nr:pyruvate dehydrogenase (acetyl-transferring) E1 component subunit alpha [Alphaproteobacteria bacterium]
VQEVKEKRDPIEHLKERLLKDALASEADFKAIDKEVKDVIARAAEFAQMSPEPDPSELWTDVTVAH